MGQQMHSEGDCSSSDLQPSVEQVRLFSIVHGLSIWNTCATNISRIQSFPLSNNRDDSVNQWVVVTLQVRDALSERLSGLKEKRF